MIKQGQRVRVATHHRWIPDRYGTIKKVQRKSGNRFLVKFDDNEPGLWHDEDGDAVLQLCEKDLVLEEHDSLDVG